MEQLRHTSLNHDIIVEFAVAPAMEQISKAAGKPAEQFLTEKNAGPALEIAKKVKSASVTLDFSGATLFHAELVAASNDAAAEFVAQAGGGLAMGKMQFEANKAQIPPFIPEAARKAIISLGDEVFASLTVKGDGAKVVIDLPMPKNLPEVLKQLPGVVQAVMMGAGGLPGGAAPPAQPKQ